MNAVREVVVPGGRRAPGDRAHSAGPGLGPEVATAVARRSAEVAADIVQLISREIPQLDADKTLTTLLVSSVEANVATCLQVMQHQIDLSVVRAPVAAVEHARRLAQRGTPLTELLRAYRLWHACLTDRLIRETAYLADDVDMAAAATLSVCDIVTRYADQICEEMVAVYAQSRENWRQERRPAQIALINDLLSGPPVDVGLAEKLLGYRMRQYHVGVVCRADDATIAGDQISRLRRSVATVAARLACGGEPLFVPRDESTAWAWLPLGTREVFDATAVSAAAADAGIRLAFGDAARGVTGFGLTHRQAVAAEAVSLASGSPQVAYREVAPVALMLGSADLLRAWVLSTLANLAADDEHHARLRDTLLEFLRSGGSYKATAERTSLHKNTVIYRIRKAEKALGRPVCTDRYDVELALLAGRWLGSAVLQS